MSPRPSLQVLPGLGQAEQEPRVAFCGHCGTRPGTDEPVTRVCASCHLGLIVTAAEGLAPQPGDAFLLVDGKLQICALSRRCEKLLGSAEAEAVNRQVTDLLIPADAESAGVESLITSIVHAARGDGTVRELVVRPSGEWGIRWFTRIGPCGATSAALMVLAPDG